MAATVEKVTLTLPQDLMNTVRELAPPRGRSKFIAEAIRYFIDEREKRLLREELIAGYQATAEEAAAMAEEWLPLGVETWERYSPCDDSDGDVDGTPSSKP